MVFTNGFIELGDALFRRHAQLLLQDLHIFLILAQRSRALAGPGVHLH